MKIVITGALGHIGSRLIRTVPEHFPGAEIMLLDNLSTQRYSSLFNLPPHGRYHFLETDVLTADLDAIFSGASVVVHLAAITNAAGSFQNRDLVEQVNFEGTERVARACCRTGTPLIFISTTSVYGSQVKVVDEDCSPEELQPQSPYADSKLRAEQMLQSLGREAGLRFVTCRFGTIFGTSAGMRFHTAINKFCWQAVMGLPITVWKTALHQYRPYLDLADAVEALIMIIHRELYDGRVYNVVTTNTTVNAIIEIISRFVPEISIRYVDTEIMNQLSYHVDSQRFRNAGFAYKGDLARGIQATIELLEAANTRHTGEAD
ncbi:SDR family oxidoreductase [Geobacter sp. FeAm09]|uniref:SDR family oxidoreductase n=1 Tax=Geobacter sp. FeAm09 TaxID=2597769 RepID=UPI0011F07C3D|nr:SDR family oxidoreductase [Geobacter sp. FeAm09]QEM66792.1 SDR family oxidoreductase [Geobacter sp. FeAm09]